MIIQKLFNAMEKAKKVQKLFKEGDLPLKELCDIYGISPQSYYYYIRMVKSSKSKPAKK